MKNFKLLNLTNRHYAALTNLVLNNRCVNMIVKVHAINKRTQFTALTHSCCSTTFTSIYSIFWRSAQHTRSSIKTAAIQYRSVLQIMQYICIVS